MSVCERRYAATQFALLSAIYALSRWAAGLMSGVLAERLGFAALLLLHISAGVAGVPAAASSALRGVSRSNAQPRPRAIAVAASTMRITSTACT